MQKFSRVPLLLFLLQIISPSSPQPQETNHGFLRCITLLSPATNLSQLVHTPAEPGYPSLLASTIQNLRFASRQTPKPRLILTPKTTAEVQASVACSRSHGLSLRVRSGGHDTEGLSYRSLEPCRFAVVDLAGLRSVHVEAELGVARVQAGATLGELYYAIAEKDGTLGFPAGICPTVCVGGHLSGGGFGPLMRKYGLAADNVVDAEVVDASGNLLDREAMGEDLFWAIRGGGGGSFGIVVSWTVKLVPVPPVLSAFTVRKFLERREEEEAMVEFLGKWQLVAHRLPDDLFIKVGIAPKVSKDGKRRPLVAFKSLFLGNCGGLVAHMEKHLPELGVGRSDCIEMSWIQFVLYDYGYTNGQPVEILLDRTLQPKDYYKVKLDYLTQPIPATGLAGFLARIIEDRGCSIDIDPQGGRMSEISESETPYAHRRKYLYNVQYSVKWRGDGNGTTTDEEKHLDWMRRVHKYMTPYVSKNPRAAYINFRDLDLGRNAEKNTSYVEAKVWGRKYFGVNFRRLASVKGEVDPKQVFWSEQSIPPLVVTKRKIQIELDSEN